MNANVDNCSHCVCHHQETCLSGYHPLVGNGLCNDETNIFDCYYDGGDCCGYNFNSEHCKECKCLHQEVCSAGLNHPLVGDGFCNAEANNLECFFDGGDCCLNPELVGNSICNDETNIPQCNHDGGDCCGPNVWTCK